jgi:hypothetical protein
VKPPGFDLSVKEFHLDEDETLDWRYRRTSSSLVPTAFTA